MKKWIISASLLTIGVALIFHGGSRSGVAIVGFLAYTVGSIVLWKLLDGLLKKTGLSVRRGLKEFVAGDVRPVAQLWEGIPQAGRKMSADEATEHTLSEYDELYRRLADK